MSLNPLLKIVENKGLAPSPAVKPKPAPKPKPTSFISDVVDKASGSSPAKRRVTPGTVENDEAFAERVFARGSKQLKMFTDVMRLIRADQNLTGARGDKARERAIKAIQEGKTDGIRSYIAARTAQVDERARRNDRQRDIEIAKQDGVSQSEIDQSLESEQQLSRFFAKGQPGVATDSDLGLFLRSASAVVNQPASIARVLATGDDRQSSELGAAGGLEELLNFAGGIALTGGASRAGSLAAGLAARSTAGGIRGAIAKAGSLGVGSAATAGQAASRGSQISRAFITSLATDVPAVAIAVKDAGGIDKFADGMAQSIGAGFAPEASPAELVNSVAMSLVAVIGGASLGIRGVQKVRARLKGVVPDHVLARAEEISAIRDPEAKAEAIEDFVREPNISPEDVDIVRGIELTNPRQKQAKDIIDPNKFDGADVNDGGQGVDIVGLARVARAGSEKLATVPRQKTEALLNEAKQTRAELESSLSKASRRAQKRDAKSKGEPTISFAEQSKLRFNLDRDIAAMEKALANGDALPEHVEQVRKSARAAAQAILDAPNDVPSERPAVISDKTGSSDTVTQIEQSAIPTDSDVVPQSSKKPDSVVPKPKPIVKPRANPVSKKVKRPSRLLVVKSAEGPQSKVSDLAAKAANPVKETPATKPVSEPTPARATKDQPTPKQAVQPKGNTASAEPEATGTQPTAPKPVQPTTDGQNAQPTPKGILSRIVRWDGKDGKEVTGTRQEHLDYRLANGYVAITKPNFKSKDPSKSPLYIATKDQSSGRGIKLSKAEYDYMVNRQGENVPGAKPAPKPVAEPKGPKAPKVAEAAAVSATKAENVAKADGGDSTKYSTSKGIINPEKRAKAEGVKATAGRPTVGKFNRTGTQHVSVAISEPDGTTSSWSIRTRDSKSKEPRSVSWAKGEALRQFFLAHDTDSFRRAEAIRNADRVNTASNVAAPEASPVAAIREAKVTRTSADAAADLKQAIQDFKNAGGMKGVTPKGGKRGGFIYLPQLSKAQMDALTRIAKASIEVVGLKRKEVVESILKAIGGRSPMHVGMANEIFTKLEAEGRSRPKSLSEVIDAPKLTRNQTQAQETAKPAADGKPVFQPAQDPADRLRAELGIAPVSRGGRKLPDVVESPKTKEVAEQGAAFARNWQANPRPISAEETVGMAAAIVDSQAALKAAQAKHKQLTDAGNIDEAVRVAEEVDRHLGDLADLTFAVTKTGSEWGMSGLARQMELRRGGTKESLMFRLNRAKRGTKATSKEIDTALKIGQKFEDIEAEVQRRVNQIMKDKIDIPRRLGRTTGTRFPGVKKTVFSEEMFQSAITKGCK